MRRIIRDTAARKLEIIEAADSLFKARGYEKTTIIDILKKTGIAKGTFYYYFRSKKELLNDLVMNQIENDARAARKIAIDESAGINEKILRILTSIDRKSYILDELHRVENAEMHQKINVELILKIAPVLADIVRQGIREGLYENPYPLETVEFLLTGSQFLFDPGVFAWKPREIESRARAFVLVIESALHAKKGSFDFMLGLFSHLTPPDK